MDKEDRVVRVMRVEYDPEIRSMDDSVEKFLAPMLAAPAKIAVGAAKLGANAIKAGAAKRKTCQKGKFQGMTARTIPMGA